MAPPQKTLYEGFIFDPFHGGDPGPDIFRLVEGLLDPAVRLQLARVVLDTHINVAQARVQGMQQFAEVMAKAAG